MIFGKIEQISDSNNYQIVRLSIDEYNNAHLLDDIKYLDVDKDLVENGATLFNVHLVDTGQKCIVSRITLAYCCSYVDMGNDDINAAELAFVAEE